MCVDLHRSGNGYGKKTATHQLITVRSVIKTCDKKSIFHSQSEGNKKTTLKQEGRESQQISNYKETLRLFI